MNDVLDSDDSISSYEATAHIEEFKPREGLRNPTDQEEDLLMTEAAVEFSLEEEERSESQGEPAEDNI